jgi:hypothetical protein
MNLRLRSTVLLLFTLAGLDLRAELPSPGNLLPDDTLVALTVPDATIARTQFRASNSGRLWADAAMMAFRTNFEAGFQTKFAGPMEKETGLALADLAELARGQVTLALLRDGWKAGAEDSSGPSWFLAFDAKDRSPKLTELLTGARKKLAGNTNAALRTLRIHEVEFTSVTLDLRSRDKAADPKAAKPDDADDEEDGAKVEFAFGQVGTAFLAGTSPTGLERLVQRATGTNLPPGLGGKARFTAVATDAFPDAAAWAYVDTSAFYEQMSPGLGSVFGMLSLLGADPAKVVPATGLASIQAAGASVRITPEGTVSQLRILAPASERTGVAKVFETVAKDAAVLPGIPVEATSFLRWRIDGKAAWKALEDALKRISPQIAGLAQLTVESAGQVFDSDFNLQRDLSGNLGDDFVSFSLPATGTNLSQLANSAQVQLISSPNPPRLVAGWKALEALVHMQAGALQFTERTGQGGQKILVAKVAGKGGEQTAFHLTTTSNYVVVSETGAAMDLFLAGSTNGLASLTGVTEVSAMAGGTTNGVFGLLRHGESLRATWEGLRTAKSLESLMPPGTTSLEAVQAVETWADFKLLPPFEQISRYWTLGAVSGGSDPQGFRFRWVQLGAK